MNECPYVLNYEVLFQIDRVTVYICQNDMNLTKTLEELEKIASHLKMEFKMNDLGKTHLRIDLKLPLSIPMIFHMLYANETLEEVMESEIRYLSSTLRFVVLSSLY